MSARIVRRSIALGIAAVVLAFAGTSSVSAGPRDNWERSSFQSRHYRDDGFRRSRYFRSDDCSRRRFDSFRSCDRGRNDRFGFFNFGRSDYGRRGCR